MYCMVVGNSFWLKFANQRGYAFLTFDLEEKKKKKKIQPILQKKKKKERRKSEKKIKRTDSVRKKKISFVKIRTTPPPR